MESEIRIDPKELKAICKEYEFDKETAIFEEDERVYDIKEALTKIDRADFIIFSLYMEMQSERKVAKQLGVSRTPINRAIKRIKQQIRDLMDDVN